MSYNNFNNWIEIFKIKSCHFVFGWSAKVFGKIRKSSLIFGGPRVSLCVSGLTANQNFWCSRVFLAVLRVFRGIMGCSGGIMGCSRGVPGLFWAVPGCSGLFRGCSGVFRVCSGFYRHPLLSPCPIPRHSIEHLRNLSLQPQKTVDTVLLEHVRGSSTACNPTFCVWIHPWHTSVNRRPNTIKYHPSSCDSAFSIVVNVTAVYSNTRPSRNMCFWWISIICFYDSLLEFSRADWLLLIVACNAILSGPEDKQPPT